MILIKSLSQLLHFFFYLNEYYLVIQIATEKNLIKTTLIPLSKKYFKILYNEKENKHTKSETKTRLKVK